MASTSLSEDAAKTPTLVEEFVPPEDKSEASDDFQSAEQAWELERDLALHNATAIELDEKKAMEDATKHTNSRGILNTSACASSNGLQRKQTKNDSLFNALCAVIVEHQVGEYHFLFPSMSPRRAWLPCFYFLHFSGPANWQLAGLSINLMLLLALTHGLFPRARPLTRKFFELSYYDASIGKYRQGMDDAWFVVFWIVAFTGLRAGVMDYILKPLARAGGIRKDRVRLRFAEQAWLVIYDSISWSLGMVRYWSSQWLFKGFFHFLVH